MTTLKNSMLKKGKKGFTLTELAIVIAVIAILIAVLVPTFSSVITKARQSNESVACKNEWTNFYIDADIAANGTDENYLVVYNDNTYSENNETYYHGYLATKGVYDTETQYSVSIKSTLGVAVCNDVTYNYVGSYEYMASQVSIYSTGTTAYTTTSYKDDDMTNTVDCSYITISGSNGTYYVTGTLSENENAAKELWGYKNTSDYYPTSLFYIRTYLDVASASVNWVRTTSSSGKIKTWYPKNSTTTDETKVTNQDLGDILYSSEDTSYIDWVLDGTTTKFVITYNYNVNDTTETGTITIYNNASQPD